MKLLALPQFVLKQFLEHVEILFLHPPKHDAEFLLSLLHGLLRDPFDSAEVIADLC
jgi:hypothetical protein